MYGSQCFMTPSSSRHAILACHSSERYTRQVGVSTLDAPSWRVYASRHMGKVTGRQLREVREAARLTQQQAAKLCDVGYRTWQRWEAATTKTVLGVFFDKIAALKLRPKKKR